MSRIIEALLRYEPLEYGELTVDDVACGFDPTKLNHNDLEAKIIHCAIETADIRCREDGGNPATSTGIFREPGDEFFVVGVAAIKQFRAIRTGTTSGILRYTVFF